MKKTIFFCLTISIFLLTSCQTNKLEITQQASSTAAECQATITLTPGITNNPTATMTPTPEDLADVFGLETWLKNYVYAFSSDQSSASVESQVLDLKNEILMNRDEYLQERNIAGTTYTFLVIDDIPIAYQDRYGIWDETTMKIMGDFSGLEVGTLMSPNVIRSRFFWRDEYHIGAICIPSNEVPPMEQTMDWGWNDYQLEFARANNLEKTRLHMVLFPNEVPAWFDETATWEDLEYLVEVVVNYAIENDIDQIVVVGEATYCFNDEYCDPYFRLFGLDYIVRAFEMTREMYPEAKLIYEDGFNHVPGSIASEKTMEIANLLHEKGLIDYVGLEMHTDENSIPEKEALLALIDDYPVPVIMTSFTAQLNYLPEDQRDEMMNEITKTVFDTCLESSRCSSVSTWGESDKECWENRSVLFDESIKRKSAYYIAMQSMYLHLNSN